MPLMSFYCACHFIDKCQQQPGSATPEGGTQQTDQKQKKKNGRMLQMEGGQMLDTEGQAGCQPTAAS